MGMIKQPQATPFPLRMPDDMRPRLEARANANGRSANAEIVAILAGVLDAGTDLSSLSTDDLPRETDRQAGRPPADRNIP